MELATSASSAFGVMARLVGGLQKSSFQRNARQNLWIFTICDIDE
jgi:hypothetical protein